MYNKLRKLSTYTAHSTTILFVCGFIFDMFLLPDITEPLARFIGILYLSLVALLIMFREWLISRNTATHFEQKIYAVSTFGIAYFSGSALSFVFIYALRSAALSVSWPLFLILLICIITNEYVATHNYRFTIDVGVLFIAVLFYTIFNIPLVLKTQNDMAFDISIGISVLVSIVYIYFLQFMSETAKDETSRGYALAVGIPMFVGMLYFLNVIPAVPLSLHAGGTYHNIIRTEEGEYLAREEVDSRFMAKYRTPVYHLTPVDNGVFFFSSIEAPAELTAPITHVWEYYDTTKKRWIPSTVISFTLAGGRDDGYRAYSHKENITEGLWRVTVKVDQSRIVGRVKFWIEKQNSAEIVETKI